MATNLIWYIPLLLALKERSITDNIYLVYCTNQTDSVSTQINFELHHLFGHLSNSNVSMDIVDIPTLLYLFQHEKLHKFWRTLFVMADDGPETQQFFEEVSGIQNNYTLDYTNWVVLVNPEFVAEEYFAKVNIPFNCRIKLALRENNLVKIHEAYRITPTSSLTVVRYGTWRQQNEDFLEPFINDDIYATRADLQQNKITVTTFTMKPYVTVDTNDSMTAGIIYRVWEELKTMYNFSYEIITTRKHTRLTDTFDGLINVVESGRADVGLQLLTMSPKRIEQVDFSWPIIITPGVIVVKQNPNEVNWNAFLSPYTYGIWICLLITIIISPIVIQLMKFAGRKYGIEVDKNSFGQITLDFFSAFCQQGTENPPDNMAARIVYITIYMSSVVVYAAYAASLISLLAVKKHSKPFQSLEELTKLKHYTLGIYGSTGYDFLMSTTSDIEKLLDKEENMPQSFEEGLERVCQIPRYVFYLSEMMFKTKRPYLPCAVEVVKTKTIHTMTFVNKKHYPLAPLLSRGLLKMRDRGVLSRIIVSEMNSDFDIISDATIFVDFIDIIPILVFLGVAIVVTILFMFLERAWRHTINKYRYRNQSHRNKKLFFKDHINTYSTFSGQERSKQNT